MVIIKFNIIIIVNFFIIFIIYIYIICNIEFNIVISIGIVRINIIIFFEKFICVVKLFVLVFLYNVFENDVI